MPTTSFPYFTGGSSQYSQAIGTHLSVNYGTYKRPSKLNNKKQTIELKNWQNISTDTTRETHRWQISPCKNTNIDMIAYAKCLQGCEEPRTFIKCWWECKMATTVVKNVQQFLKKVKHRFTIRSSHLTSRCFPKRNESIYS